MQAPPAMEQKTRPNLKKAVGELVEDGMTLDITAPTLPGVAIQLQLQFVHT